MKTKILILTLAGAVIGFLIARQIAAHSRVQVLTKSDEIQVMAVETAELLKNATQLEQEKANLTDQKTKLTGSTGDSEQALEEEISRLQIVSGTAQVRGEGVEISFDRALLVPDMTDLINALRNIGTEAISINGKRITGRSGFVLSDGETPVVVRAIGKMELLKEAVERRGGILEQIGHGTVTEQNDLSLPAAAFSR